MTARRKYTVVLTVSTRPHPLAPLSPARTTVHGSFFDQDRAQDLAARLNAKLVNPDTTVMWARVEELRPVSLKSIREVHGL